VYRNNGIQLESVLRSKVRDDVVCLLWKSCNGRACHEGKYRTLPWPTEHWALCKNDES
jgi:hypothetical protein